MAVKMKRKLSFLRYILLFALLLFCSSVSYAQEDVNEIFDKANSLYMSENYTEAVQVYLSIIEKGYESAAVYYNLGNTYYKLGNTGKAVLYYEKAKKINPRDDDINTNLKMTRLSIADKITPLPELFYMKYFNLFASMLGPFGWMKIFLFLFCVLCLTISALILIKDERAKYFLKKSVFILAAVTIIILGVTIYTSYEISKHDSGVIMSEKVDVYASPAEDSTELFAIHEGTKVTIKRIQGMWIEISLADGKVGWIIKEHIGVI